MKEKGKILILDDDNYVMLSIRIMLEQHYEDVRGINNPLQIESALAENHYDVVILDMNFKAGETSGSDGLKYLRQIKQASPTTSVVFSPVTSVEFHLRPLSSSAYDQCQVPPRPVSSTTCHQTTSVEFHLWPASFFTYAKVSPTEL